MSKDTKKNEYNVISTSQGQGQVKGPIMEMARWLAIQSIIEYSCFFKARNWLQNNSF